MIQILKIPESVLNKSTAVFTTYIYIIANRYKRSKTIKVTYETLAQQMDINIRHVKNYVKELITAGVIEVSEPNIKKRMG
jgi:predicted transcriptional regulator